MADPTIFSDQGVTQALPGDGIALVLDTKGGELAPRNAVQASAALQPELIVHGGFTAARLGGGDHQLKVTFPDGFFGDVFLAGVAGYWVERDVDIAAGGDLTIGPINGPVTPGILRDVGGENIDLLAVVPVARTLSEADVSLLAQYYARRGGVKALVVSPASLFAAGDGALIQRRSDAFFVENTASTHAVDTNAVGFATDASEGAGYSGGEFTGLGSEDNSDEYFQDEALWDDTTASISFIAAGISWTSSSSGARIATTQGGTPLVIGKYYLCEIVIDSISQGSISSHRDFGAGNTPNFTTAGTHTYVAKAVEARHPELRCVGTTTAVVSRYSVRELPGHHATQATTSYKPSLQTGGLLFDGNDDRLTGAPKPTTSGTIAARFNGSTASRVIFGSQAASDGRCFLALDASGKIAAGIGAQGTSTIAGGADIRGAWHTAAVTWNGLTVTLYLDGVSVYSAAQSGAVNTTVAMMLGALNANGTAAAFWAGTVSDALVIDRVLTTDELTNLNDYWSA